MCTPTKPSLGTDSWDVGGGDDDGVIILAGGMEGGKFHSILR